MLRWLIAVAVLVGIGTFIDVLTPACDAADDGWVITRFDARLQVDRDATVHVVETIDVDFGDLERHGIFRDLPYAYPVPGDDGQARITRLAIERVSDASGVDIPFQVFGLGSFRRVRIGSPDLFVTGARTYVIEYNVTGALNPFADHGEITWNVTGDQWPVPIEASSATVTLAAGAFTRANCFQGEGGSTEPCAETTATGDVARFRAGRTLEPGEGWTIAGAFPPGTVAVPPLVFGPRPPDPPETLAVGIKPVAWFAAIGVLLFQVARLVVAWFRFGRDPGTDGPTVTEIEPPDGLRPAELAYLLGGDSDGFTGVTLVDLAARRYIDIRETGDDEYEFVLKNVDDNLSKFELRLLDGLFKKHKEKVSTAQLRSQKFYLDVNAAQNLLQDAVKKRSWFNGDPKKVRGRYSERGWLTIGFGIIAVIGLAVSIAIAAALSTFWGSTPLNIVLGGIIVAVALAIAGIFEIIAARWMPARTPAGSAMLRRVDGFRPFMDVADRTRQEFYERKGVFAQYVPYAMAFGMVDRWASVLRDLGIPIEAPSYFRGRGSSTFAVGSFASSIGSLGDAVSGAALPPAPSGGGSSGGSSSTSFSSSSSSSSFGGGGSSGGGTGGGGGGSW